MDEEFETMEKIIESALEIIKEHEQKIESSNITQ